MLGCEVESRTREAIGEALITIGELVLKIPHLSGKIIGVFLVGAGVALRFQVQTSKGSTRSIEIKLTDEQMAQLREALAEDVEVHVKQPDGKEVDLPLKKK